MGSGGAQPLKWYTILENPRQNMSCGQRPRRLVNPVEGSRRGS